MNTDLDNQLPPCLIKDGALDRVFALLIFAVAAYMIWHRVPALGA